MAHREVKLASYKSMHSKKARKTQLSSAIRFYAVSIGFQ